MDTPKTVDVGAVSFRLSLSHPCVGVHCIFLGGVGGRRGGKQSHRRILRGAQLDALVADLVPAYCGENQRSNREKSAFILYVADVNACRLAWRLSISCSITMLVG